MLHDDEQLLTGNEYNKVMSRSRVRRLFQKEYGRQTDKLFFSLRHLKLLSIPQSSFFTIQKDKKRSRKQVKQFCDGPTNEPTDQPKSGLWSCD